MNVDDVYKLIIEYLVQGYPIRLEHYDLPNYEVNKHNEAFNIMLIRISSEASIKWDDIESGYNSPWWDHQELFDKYDCK